MSLSEEVAALISWGLLSGPDQSSSGSLGNPQAQTAD